MVELAEGLCGGEGESWVRDGWFWVCVIRLWVGREMGETMGAGRGVLEGVEFGGRVERRAEGEDVQGQIESRISRSRRLSKRSNALSRLFREIRALGEHPIVRTNRRIFREVFLWVDRALIYGC